MARPLEGLDDREANTVLVLALLSGFCTAGFFVYSMLGDGGGGGGVGAPSGRVPIVILLLVVLGPVLISFLAGTIGGGTIVLMCVRLLARRRRKGELLRALQTGDYQYLEAAKWRDDRLAYRPLDSDGNIPIQVAAKAGQTELVGKMARGAWDWHRVNKRGQTIFDLAPPDKAEAMLTAFCESKADDNLMHDRAGLWLEGVDLGRELAKRYLRLCAETMWTTKGVELTLPHKKEDIAGKLIELAQEEYHKRDYVFVVAALNAAQSWDWKSLTGEHFLYRAIAKWNIDHLKGAIEDADRAIAEAPKPSDGYMIRAAIHETAGRVDEAIKDYQSALQLDPGNEICQERINELLLS